jgi:hypothetical protein
MVNCLNVKKYVLSIVSDNLEVSVSQKVSDTKSKSDLSRHVSIPHILYFPNFTFVFIIDLVLIGPQSVGKRTHDLKDTVNAKKRWKTIC